MPALSITLNAINKNSTLLFPDNNYAFGNQSTTIKEKDVPNPTTKKGEIRLQLISKIKQATEQEKCKAVILRLPDFFGPNVSNGLMKPVFGNAIKRKPMNWLVDADTPHQLAYTPDVAKLFYLLSKEKKTPNFFLLHYGGEQVSSIRDWGAEISRIAGSPNKMNVAPKFILSIILIFNPMVKELKENFYQFENAIILNESKIKERYPNFKPATMEEAIKNTLDWFKKNK